MFEVRECVSCPNVGETLNGLCPDCSKMTESKAYGLAVGFQDDGLTDQLERILLVQSAD